MSCFYCSCCKRNIFIERKKHVYTKKHKKQLAFVLNKFLEKTEALQCYLDIPKIIHNKEKEIKSSFWCRICDCEVDNKDNRFVSFATFRHLASKSHKTHVDKYWKDNAVGNLLPKDMVLITKPEWKKFIRKIKKATKELELEEQSKDKKHYSEEYTQTPDTSINILQQHIDKSKLSINTSSNNNNNIYQPKDTTTYIEGSGGTLTPILPFVHTIGVAEGLTSIVPPKLLPGESNIHNTNSTPPWLMTQSKEGKKSIILEQKKLEKKRKENRKKRKNPNRVGAKFVEQKHLYKYDKNTWLPSFGGVWTSGPRSEHKQIYIRERKKTKSNNKKKLK